MIVSLFPSAYTFMTFQPIRFAACTAAQVTKKHKKYILKDHAFANTFVNYRLFWIFMPS